MLYGIDSPSLTAKMIAAIPDLTATDVPDWVWSTAAGQSAGDRISFVIRYLKYKAGADMNVAEIMALTDAGLRVVSVYEASATASMLTEATGYSHGTDAFTAAQAVSQPQGTPIYFAIDFAPTTAQLPDVTTYFDGVRRALDDFTMANSWTVDYYAIGVYARPNVLEHCRDTDAPRSPGNRLATFYWRFGGHGAWPDAHIWQLYGPNVYGSTSAFAKDASAHYFNSEGKVMGEWFCHLGVDFNTTERSLDEIGAWIIPSA